MTGNDEVVLPQRFARLVDEWKRGRGHSSKLTDLVMHPAFQRIIGIGERAVPLLIEEMKERPDHWISALRAITGVDPVPRESWGKLREIAASWDRVVEREAREPQFS